MNTLGENNIWTPSRLRSELAAHKGVAPAPSCYVVWRVTIRPDAPDLGGYELPGESGRQDESAFDRWLMDRNLAGPERLSVSVLVIREHLDEAGLVRECVLERRRGGSEGPYHGNVARVEFTGAAKRIRRYRASRDGRLRKLPDENDTGIAPPADAVEAVAFAGEDAAVHAYLGRDAVILDRRTPTLFEDLVGLSAIIHARRRDGSEIGCGVGWHGGTAFVIAADFARDASPLEPPADLEAAVVEALGSRGLVRLETRLDDLGFCVIAREREGDGLVTIRLHGTTPRISPYVPGRIASANEDQRRWMTYAETYEGRTVLDSWRSRDGDDIAVVTIDQDQEAWRHVIDPDGVEVGRQPGNEAAAAVLYREHVAPPDASAMMAEPSGTVAAEHAALSRIEAADESVPADSLLTKVLAWCRATALLATAIDEAAADVGSGRTVSRSLLARLSALTPSFTALNASFSAGSLDRLVAQARSGGMTGEGLAAALEELGARLRDELAQTRIVTLPNVFSHLEGEPPFGPLVELHFPAATYDIEEALRCLALRRPTAVVLHAMKVMRHGLDGMTRLLSTPKLTELSWSRIIAAVRATSGHPRDLIAALNRVRRAWRAPGLMPADKYTEEEAAAALDAVAAFVRALAARFDALGETADD
jgi:hypothetical protein